MELMEIHSRVCKLEEIITQLAKWTNFDLQKLTASVSENLVAPNLHKRKREKKRRNFAPSDRDPHHSELNIGIVVNSDVDAFEGQEKLGSALRLHPTVGDGFGNGDEYDNLEIKLEVDDEDDTANNENWQEEEVEVTIDELNLRWVSGQDENEEEDPNPNFPLPSETEETPSSTDVSYSSGGPNKKLNLSEERIIVFHPNSPSLPSPFVRMEKLTSTQLLSHGVHSSQTKTKPNLQRTRTLCPHNIEYKPGPQRHKCPKCSYSTERKMNPLRQSDRNRSNQTAKAGGGGSNSPKTFVNIVHSLEKPFVCHLCQFATTARRYLTTHIRRCHIQKKVKHLRCYFCSKKFRNNMQTLRKHMRIHTLEKLSPSRRYKCPHCTYASKSERNVTRHAQAKHENNDSRPKFKCPQCPVMLKCKRGVQNHLKFVHNMERSFLCHFCPFVTKTQSLLNLHMRNVHNPDTKYFKCYFCSDKFKYPKTLNNHLLRHTGERPYQCPSCPYSAVEKGELDVHIRNIHTSDQTLRTFSCPKCPSAFKTVHSLNSHLLLHKKLHYKCPTCSHEAVSSSRLKEHMKEKHSNDGTRVRCPHCPKTFRLPSTLRGHIRTHSDEKPFKCENEKCPFATKTRQHLSRHLTLCQFMSVGNVNRHKTILHPNPAEAEELLCNPQFEDAERFEGHVQDGDSAGQSQIQRTGVGVGVVVAGEKAVEKFEERPKNNFNSTTIPIDKQRQELISIPLDYNHSEYTDPDVPGSFSFNFGYLN